MEEVNGDTTKEAEFPWSEFLKLLLPDIWYLLSAVVVSTVNVVIMYNVLLIVKDVQKVGNVNSYNYIDARPKCVLKHLKISGNLQTDYEME